MYGGRQERLTDLVTGKCLFFQYNDAMPLHRDQRGQRRSGRAASDDNHVGVFSIS